MADADSAAATDPTRIACLFSTSGHSGVDRIARHLLPALARRGYRVDQLKVRRHGPDLGAAAGVDVIDLGSRHTYGCLPAIVRYLRAARPAVLLSDKDRVNRLALAARTLARVPTRLVFRSGTTISVDLASRGPVDRWVQRASMRRLYRLADRVIVPSTGAADDLIRFAGLPPGLVRAVPSPIVPTALLAAPPPLPGHPWLRVPGWPLLLGVGELSDRKDFDTLVRAFARVRAERPCRLMILGRGGTRDRLLALAATLGVADDVALPGFVPAPHGFMAHANLFALTSRWEGLPVALVEALAMGTPAVATDCPSGSAEVLDHGRVGRLVAVGDDAALAQAIIATLADPPPRAMLIGAVRRFEIEAATDAYLDAMGLPARAERVGAAGAAGGNG